MTGSTLAWGWADSPSTATPTSSADFESSGRFWAGEAAGGLQNGVLNSGDLAPSALSVTSTTTGNVQASFAAAAVSWVKSASGLLVPITYVADTRSFTPATLPVSTNYAVYGVEIDTTGAMALVKGANTATQLNTGTLIAANSPAVTAGKMRVLDFALWNNAGAIHFSDHLNAGSVGVNWIDRRPWARGAFVRQVKSDANAVMTGATFTPIDASRLQARVECSGVPLRVTLLSMGFTNNATIDVDTGLQMDGTFIDGFGTGNTANTTWLGGGGTGGGTENNGFSYVTLPTAGSHLFTPMFSTGAGITATLYADGTDAIVELVVEELIRQNVSNGTV